MKRTSESIPKFLASSDSVTHNTMYLGTREVPEIDGSQGAFIAVVVTLSVLIVVCCAAVFYLLRHHEPTDQERSARRERSQRAREQTLTSTSTFSGLSLASGSLGDKVKQMWQSTTGRGGGGRRGGRGWIRAGSNDEWASHSDPRGGADPDTEIGGHLGSMPVLKHGGRGRDGVHVVESPSSDTVGGFDAGHFGYAYADPFSKTVLEGTLQRSQSPLSSPMSSPREGGSVEEGHEVHSPDEDRRHRSAMSNSSVWTQAGSKFVEDI